ncbi:hypothetical protein GF324_00905 [bacterium]|nr:hypothetical protein [bacterium]
MPRSADMADKIDFVKVYKEAYSRKKTPQIFHMPALHYLAIEGKSAPESEAFQQGVAALYGTAYPVKMTWIKQGGRDYKIAPMEAQWWTEDSSVTWEFAELPREKWCWRILIPLPDFVSEEFITGVVEEKRRKGTDAPIKQVRHIRQDEGMVVQCLHLGPYSEETTTIRLMWEYAKENGFEFTGRHREIYLSDPRRTAPENLKTILRHPVTRG